MPKLLHNITFICRGCHYFTDSVRSIKSHADKCKKNTIPVQDLYKIIKEKNKELHSLKKKLPTQKISEYKKYSTHRQAILKNKGIFDFIKQIQKDKRTFETSLKKNDLSMKAISSKLIAQCFNAMEARLIALDGFESTILRPDNIISLYKMFIPLESELCVFKQEIFLSKCMDYRLALFPVKDIIARALSFTSNNIMFTGSCKEKDPYRFYIITKINEGTKVINWTMDCRLENLALYLKDSLSQFCIHRFRLIYRAIFNNNIYRLDYMNSDMECINECSQLIDNLIHLNNFLTFNRTLRKMIIEKASYQSNSKDILNMKGDDPLQIKRLNRLNSTKLKVEIIHKLFDDISEQDAHMLVCKF